MQQTPPTQFAKMRENRLKAVYLKEKRAARFMAEQRYGHGGSTGVATAGGGGWLYANGRSANA